MLVKPTEKETLEEKYLLLKAENLRLTTNMKEGKIKKAKKILKKIDYHFPIIFCLGKILSVILLITLSLFIIIFLGTNFPKITACLFAVVVLLLFNEGIKQERGN